MQSQMKRVTTRSLWFNLNSSSSRRSHKNKTKIIFSISKRIRSSQVAMLAMGRLTLLQEFPSNNPRCNMLPSPRKILMERLKWEDQQTSCLLWKLVPALPSHKDMTWFKLMLHKSKFKATLPDNRFINSIATRNLVDMMTCLRCRILRIATTTMRWVACTPHLLSYNSSTFTTTITRIMNRLSNNSYRWTTIFSSRCNNNRYPLQLMEFKTLRAEMKRKKAFISRTTWWWDAFRLKVRTRST